MPTPTNANNYEVLNDLTKLNAMLASKGLSLPPDWQTMNPQDKQQFLDAVMKDSQQAGQVAQKVNEFAQDQKENVTDLQNSGVNVQAPAMIAKTRFNLKKAQMEPPMAAPIPGATDPTAAQPATQPGQTSDCPEQFADAGQLQQCLASFQSPNDAIEFIGTKYTNANQTVSDPNNPQRTDEAFAVIKESLNDFFSTQDPSIKNKAASTIFDMILPDSAKSQTPGTDPNAVPSHEQSNVHPGAFAMVHETNEIIKKLAKQNGVKAASSVKFNLKKEAQHQSVHNVIYYGPKQNHIDAFTGQIINDWHLVERNKGFGLKIDDVLNIDFEAIWRGNVMDKYSRPYRDKEGNYVGGYIESRFEVDHNIPPMNNYQLKPGEKRRPIVPEHGILESRMEASRTKLNTDRGYAPSQKGEVFNWKKAQQEGGVLTDAWALHLFRLMIEAKKNPSAQSEVEEFITLLKNNFPPETAEFIIQSAMKRLPNQQLAQAAFAKKKVVAQLEPPKNENMLFPGDKPITSLQPKPVCKICGGDIAKLGGESQNKGVCVNCAARMPNPNMVAPSQATPAQQPMMLQKTQSIDDGIYSDGKNFIVYAQGKKKTFDTFEEAESFKKQPIDGQQLPDEAHPVKSKLKPRQREIFDTADRLHIDG